MVVIWWYISDFFGFIWNAINVIVDFFEILVEIITSSFGFIINVAGAMPLILILPISALAAISVIYKLLGRGDQS